MENTTLIQLYSFLIYLISGMVIGIFFDIFRILRKSFHTPDTITYIEDVLFWLLSGLFLLWILFYVSNGEIRIYIIFALVLGFILYMLTISKYFVNINVFIVKFFKKLLYKLLKVVMYPIKLICNPFTFFVINIKKSFLNFMKKIKNKVEKNKKIFTKRRILGKNVEKYK